MSQTSSTWQQMLCVLYGFVTPVSESRAKSPSMHPSIHSSIHSSIKANLHWLNATISKNNSFSLQPKLMAKDLLDLVASHFNLKEKEYFGIAYTDET